MYVNLEDGDVVAEFRRRLIHIVGFRYRLDAAAAEDVVQSGLTAYLQVRDRYPPTEDHLRILHGIVRNKALEYLDRCRREKEGLGRLLGQPDLARDHPTLDPDGAGASPSALHDLLRREDGRQILEALAHLKPQSRALLLRLAKVGRPQLVAETGLNPNTLDTQLRKCRLELRALLRQRGLLM